MSEHNKDLQDQLLEAGKSNPGFDIYDFLLMLIIGAPLIKAAALSGIGVFIVFFSNMPPERVGMGWSLIGYSIGAPTLNEKGVQELKSKKKKDLKQ
ncbi:hypothetical protein [Picosynechococcus sp. PCC 7117]|uniref:hypothetical protein n=1 Tax=Picosynechococcus sp. PCC 7117 TaxID=195498 RepID=UPI000810C7C4|nr:hypothetical protein [Picosynechococcus sp. PCC 7117]ANV88509.1 hypothetical protein AWQ22_14135 [Picosynechococcus sp. PCC 7117]